MDNIGLPNILYKFRNWEDGKAKQAFGRRILTEREIYFASPDQFNDPFDGTLPFKYKKEQLTPVNVFRKLVEVFTRNHKENSPLEIFKMASERQKSAGFDSDKYWRDFHKDFTKTLNETFGILSLTTKKENILMWSHYSNSHQGFCVGLDTKILFKSVICQIGGVIYSDNFPEVDLFSQDPEAIIRLTCTKSKNWAYEDEVRLVRYARRSTTILPHECFKEIIVGCNMSQINKDEILQLKRKHFPKAAYFDTKINDEKFKLDFLSIN